MKSPSLAPLYATLYPGLCDVARKYGYALAIHGSLQADLDLIAVPWVPDSLPASWLAKALADHVEACIDSPLDTSNPELKPHGRIAYNLYLGHGAKIDLSILSLSKSGCVQP